ncbi:MAG: hypothetical protein DRJ03_22920 [Chloroflexi bacterium]|nr:MAG: hypothetical protein DRJ03_22920 [Chloroflexota bacterium]
MPRPKKLSDPKIVPVVLEKQQYSELQKIARKRKTSVSEIIRKIVGDFLKKEKGEEWDLYREINFRQIGYLKIYMGIRDELLMLQSKILYAVEKLGTWPDKLIERYKKLLTKATRTLIHAGKIPDYTYSELEDLEEWLKELRIKYLRGDFKKSEAEVKTN